MYRKDSEGWLKHFDFLVLDLLCLQVAFVLAYGISGYGFYPYNLLIYRNMAIFIEFADDKIYPFSFKLFNSNEDTASVNPKILKLL